MSSATNKYASLITSLEYYSCLTLANIGIIANILNILLSSRKNIQKITMGFYNILMSIFNILLLIFAGYVTLFPVTLGQPQLISSSHYGCNILAYVIRVTIQMIQWLNLMITCDRMLCVWTATSATVARRFEFIKSKRKLFLIVTALFAISCLLNIINVFFKIEQRSMLVAAVVGEENSTQTHYNYTECVSTSLINMISVTSAVFTRIIFPIVLQVLMNAILIYKLFVVKKRLRILVMSQRSLVKEYKFALNVIVLNGFYVLSIFDMSIVDYFQRLQSIVHSNWFASVKFAHARLRLLVLVLVVYERVVILYKCVRE